jgi:alkyl sulfatase BDS1-like metallo-beta-lactamase superfamily hydrolase
MEAREPRPEAASPRQGAAAQLFSLSGDDLLESLCVRLDGQTAGPLELSFVLAFADTEERFEVTVENGVLHHRPTANETDVTLTRARLIQLVLGQTTLDATEVDGPCGDALAQLLRCLDRFDFWFNIVTP